MGLGTGPNRFWPETPALTDTACAGCTHPAINNLMLIQVTVYVYRNLAEATTHAGAAGVSSPGADTWIIRHSNILNVNGRIM
jgi:hypothetical protein